MSRVFNETNNLQPGSALKSVAIKILKFGISFAILAYLFYKAQQDENFHDIAASPKRWGWILFGVVSGFSASLAGFLRWYTLVRALQVQIRLADAIRLGFLGHLFNLMSVGVLGGDALKSVFVARHVGERKAEAVLSIFADRYIGLVTMFTFAALAFAAVDFGRFQSSDPEKLYAIQWLSRVMGIFSVLGVLSFILFFAFPNLVQWKWLQKGTRLPWVGRLFGKFLGVVGAYRSNSVSLLAAFGYSVLINLFFVCAIFGVAAGLTENHPTIGQHLLIAPISMVANAVPLPGGIGGMEFALDFLYRGFSDVELAANQGFLVALGFRLILLMVAAVGVFVYLTRRQEIRSLQRDSERVTHKD